MKHLRTAFLFTAFLVTFLPGAAHAATISVIPASGSYSVGDTISARIVVSSDVSINAVSAGLSYSNDTLSLTSISKSGSILSFWAQEPSYSNAAGTADMEGVSLGTGYAGTNGTVATLVFRAKSEGQGTVSFRSASILANDGQGTDVTNGQNGATFSITAGSGNATQEDTANPPATAGVAITSPTHPDQKKWYDNDSPQFAWSLPKGADEVRTGLDSSSSGTPTKSYAPPISSKTVDNLDDGTYYFHLQVHTASGWSAISNYRINVDTTQPRSFAITFPHGSTSVEPQPVILFDTTDAVSGIAYYEVRVGDGGPLTVTNPGVAQNPYVLPELEPGHYVVSVTAHDLADNTTTAESEFTVEGIDPPKVTSYPAELTVGDIFKVSGTTYADSEVDVTVYDKDGNQVAFESGKSKSLNNFTIVLSKHLLPGAYTFTVRAIDARGARSPATEPVPFKVDFHLIGDVLAFVANYFFIVVIFLLAVAGVVGVAIWSFHRLQMLSHTLKKERAEAESTIKKAFRLLKHDLEDHIARLHRARTDRTLTAEELAFLEQFEKDLHEAEDIIKDEFDDIPKG